MKEGDIYKDILGKYPEKVVLEFCSDAITKRFNAALKALGEKQPEIATGALGEAGFYLNLLKELSDKQNDKKKEPVVVA